MPAIRKPSAVLQATGAFAANPSRRRQGELVAGPVGDPPPYLGEFERGIWRELVADCAPGVSQSSDRVALAVLSRLLAEWRTKPAEFGCRRYAVLLALLARCGLTPADRSRIVVVPDAPAEKPKTGLASFRR